MSKQIQIELAQAAVKELVPQIRTKRDHLVEVALKQVGTTEDPGGKNRVIYNTWFYGRQVQDGDRPGSKYPWCCTFVSWVFNEIGKKLPAADYKNGWCSVPNLYQYAQNHGMVTENPRPGDLVIYSWKGTQIDHIGIYLGPGETSGYIHAVEGNTSLDDKGSQDNGGGVAIKIRNRRLVRAYVDVTKFLE